MLWTKGSLLASLNEWDATLEGGVEVVVVMNVEWQHRASMRDPAGGGAEIVACRRADDGTEVELGNISAGDWERICEEVYNNWETLQQDED